MELAGYLKGAPRYSWLWIPVTFQIWKRVLMRINMSYFNTPLKFPLGHDPHGHPINRLGFHCPPAWPYRSVKTLTGAFTTIQVFHNCWENACNSDHQADLFLPSSIRVVAFQTGCCPFTLELLSTSQAALCLSKATLSVNRQLSEK